MDIVIWIGTALSIIGLAGIGYTVVAVMRAKRAGLDDDALRAKMSRILPINLIALFMSTIGLMTVVVGVMLG